MTNLVAVSRERHAGKVWRRVENYAFAGKDALTPVVGSELARVALMAPLAFVQLTDHFVLVAVLSLTPGRNMFVGPQGRWLGNYAPASLRAYPFRLLLKKGTADVLLCVDEDSGLVVDGNSTGEAFFAEDGSISPPLKSVTDFLTEVEASRRATDLAVSALAETGVIKPWPIKVKGEQGEKPIDGLYHIDEAALAALPDEAFLKLRKFSALSIAYGQLLSAGQLGIFPQLARLQAQLTPPTVAALPESLDSLFELPSDDMIQFK